MVELTGVTLPSFSGKSVVFVNVTGLFTPAGARVAFKFTLPPGQIDWLVVTTLTAGLAFTITVTGSIS